jgi:hypothetical protein
MNTTRIADTLEERILGLLQTEIEAGRFCEEGQLQDIPKEGLPLEGLRRHDAAHG